MLLNKEIKTTMIGTIEFIKDFIVSYLFTKALDKVTEKSIDRAYNTALKKWCKNDAIRAYYSILKFNNIEAFYHYVNGEINVLNGEIIELCRLFESELDKDTKTSQYISNLRIKNIQVHQNELSEKTAKIADTVNEIDININKKPEQATSQYKLEPTVYSQTSDDCIKYIKRTCTKTVENPSVLDRYYHPEKYQEYSLIDYVLGLGNSDNNKLVLCGDAQSGKTTELRNLFKELSESGLVRVCYRSIKGWVFDLPPLSEQEQKETVIIIDALDERFDDIERNTLFNSINNYAQIHPFLKMVVSCRSNFKEISNLTLFEKIQLDDLKWSDAKEIIKTRVSNWESLTSEIKSKGLYEFTSTPFYLTTILDYYHEHGSLPDRKLQLYDYIISKQIAKEDKKAISSRLRIKTKCRELLEEVAIVIQMTNKTGLTEDDFLYLFNNDYNKLELLKRSGMLKRDSNNYEFTHNAFKEYLASNYLLQITSLDEIKQLCCYTNTGIIKSTWYNTIALYLAQLSNDNAIFNKIFSWITKENRSMVLYIEPQYIESNIRYGLFNAILEDYKKMGIMYSRRGDNRYNALMRFGYCAESLNYINKELLLLDRHNSHAINLFYCLRFINWSVAIIEFKELSESLLDSMFSAFEVLYQHDNAWSVWEPFDNIYLQGSDDVIKRLYTIVKNNEQPDVLNNFIRIAYESNLSNEYIDFIIDKSKFIKDYATKDGVHHTVTLSWVNLSLSKVDTKEDIKKVIRFIESELTNSNKRHYSLIDYKDIVQKILNNAKQCFSFDELSNMFIRIFVFCNNPISHDGDLSAILDILAIYVEENHKAEMLFNKILNHFAKAADDESYSPLKLRCITNMLCCFANNERIENAAKQFAGTELGYKIVSYIYQQSYTHRAFVEDLIKQYYPVFYEEAQKHSPTNKQRSDLEELFNYTRFKKSVMDLLSECSGKSEFLKTKLNKWYDIDDDNARINVYVHRFIEMSRSNGVYDIDKITNYINNEEMYKHFIFEESYQVLNSSNSALLSTSMKDVIKNIAKDCIVEIANNNTSFYRHMYHPFDMLINDELGNIGKDVLLKLLPYSSYQYYDSDSLTHISLFDYITRQKTISCKEITNYILNEIKSKDDIYWFDKQLWAKYLIDNNVSNSYSTLIEWAKEKSDDSYHLIKLLVSDKTTRKLITKKAVIDAMPIENKLQLYRELVPIEGYDYKWIKEDLEQSFDILESNNKISSLRLLLYTGSTIGLDYINANKDYYMTRDILLCFIDETALEGLFEALEYVLNTKSELRMMEFHELHNSILSSIGKIAQKSIESYKKIKEQIDKWVRIDKARYAYLYYQLEEWEYMLYESKTISSSIFEAKRLINN